MDPIESYIRTAALQRGIDPDQAMRVSRSEGFNSYTGDNGSSFGPFQLHYGGVAPGGNAVSGLGDEFTAQTGLDARDPSTVKDQIDFALDHAAQNGWGAWHGWKGSPWAGINGAPVYPGDVPMAQAFNKTTGQTTTMDPTQTPTLFGGNPTPVGAFGALGRMLGIGTEPELGRRLQNAGAALMSVGNFGKPGMAGAAAMQEAANQPHYDVVTDALGNRYILDKRTGAITMPGMNGGAPNGMAPQAGTGGAAASPGFNNSTQDQQQQFKPSGDPHLDVVANSPLGAVTQGKEALEQALKDKNDLEGAADSAKQLHDLAVRQMEIAQSGKIVQGPGVMNWLKEHAAEATGGALGGVDLDLQNQFDLNNKAMSTLMGSSILNNARIAGPELRFLQLIHPDSEYTQGANIGALKDIIQRTERMQAHAAIGRQYRVLGPNYQAEKNAYDKANPLYSNHGNDTGRPTKPLSSFWQQ